MFTSEVAFVKSCHGISVKWSRYQYTGPTDTSLLVTGDDFLAHTDLGVINVFKLSVDLKKYPA